MYLQKYKINIMSKLISIEEIPVIKISRLSKAIEELSDHTSFHSVGKEKGLPILADGIKAYIFLSKPDSNSFYSSEKIVISFIDKHPKWKHLFSTKYFMINKPGKLEWGRDGDYFQIEHRT